MEPPRILVVLLFPAKVFAALSKRNGKWRSKAETFDFTLDDGFWRIRNAIRPNLDLLWRLGADVFGPCRRTAVRPERTGAKRLFVDTGNSTSRAGAQTRTRQPD